jgi:hypothetical protein
VRAAFGDRCGVFADGVGPSFLFLNALELPGYRIGLTQIGSLKNLGPGDKEGFTKRGNLLITVGVGKWH